MHSHLSRIIHTSHNVWTRTGTWFESHTVGWYQLQLYNYCVFNVSMKLQHIFVRLQKLISKCSTIVTDADPSPQGLRWVSRRVRERVKERTTNRETEKRRSYDNRSNRQPCISPSLTFEVSNYYIRLTMATKASSVTRSPSVTEVKARRPRLVLECGVTSRENWALWTWVRSSVWT